MRYVFFLGSNPTLSKAELITKLNRNRLKFQIEEDNKQYIVLDALELSPTLLRQLGGIDRIAKIMATGNSLWNELELAQTLLPFLAKKGSLGFSAINIPAWKIHQLALAVKKSLRSLGIKINFILPQSKRTQLNAAQVIFNKLTSDPNHEITIINSADHYFLTKTEQIQDIQSYEIRDTSRPARDARIGLLPPKLAQIMLNLVPHFLTDPPLIYDPFCGMGTILQEGLLFGYRMVGSDNNSHMIEYTRKNIDWLKRNFTLPAPSAMAETNIFMHDINQPFPVSLNGAVDAIVTEPYLGQPLKKPLPPAAANAQMNHLSRQYVRFFEHARAALKDNSYIVFVFPAFREANNRSNFIMFNKKIFDEITSIGYRLKHLPESGQTSNRGTILYHRPDALVAREITLWQKT